MLHTRSRGFRVPAVLLFALFFAGGQRVLPAAPVWIEQGPGPSLNGQTEGIPDNPVSGAVNAIAAVPGNPDVLYVGSVNGGIWKTTNGTAAAPSWTPLTDFQLPRLAINSLAVSPVNSNVVFAGTGSTSSFGFAGGSGVGVARSVDGGATWSLFATATFNGRRINSIVPTTLSGGAVVLAATLFDGGGVYRSVNGGVTFARISGAAGSGLPGAGVSSLVADPGNPNRFYAAVPRVYGGGAAAGVYRSTNGGVTWTAVSAGLTGLDESARILLSVHNSAGGNAVYAVIIESEDLEPVPGFEGEPSGVFRSANQGGAWTAMGVPSPAISPGGQARAHFAIAADPANPNVVFIAGDAQRGPFPNVNGCTSFVGNVFRGDAALLPANAWQNVVCNGANGTAPHADARAMIFDANGNLLQGNDGGIVRLVDPGNATGQRRWASVNGNLRTMEMHSVAYDPLSGILFGGTQDNGATIQLVPGDPTWFTLVGGDGGLVAVDADQSAHPGFSIRYTSSQFLGNFNRSYWDAANNFLGIELVPLIVNGTGGMDLFDFDPTAEEEPEEGEEEHEIPDESDPTLQFTNPFVLNAVDPGRMLIGTGFLYESFDGGDTLNFLGGTGAPISALAYGSRFNGAPRPDVLYLADFADTNSFYRSLSPARNDFVQLSAYPGFFVQDIALDPQNFQRLYVLDFDNRVWTSLDAGASWTELTANLPALTNDLWTIEIFSPDASVRNTVLMVAGRGGVFQMRRPGAAGTGWTRLSSGLPNVLFLDLRYDYTNDVLAACSLGRGAWTLTGFFRGGGGTGAASVKARPRAFSPLPTPPVRPRPRPIVR